MDQVILIFDVVRVRMLKISKLFCKKVLKFEKSLLYQSKKILTFSKEHMVGNYIYQSLFKIFQQPNHIFSQRVLYKAIGIDYEERPRRVFDQNIFGKVIWCVSLCNFQYIFWYNCIIVLALHWLNFVEKAVGKLWSRGATGLCSGLSI